MNIPLHVPIPVRLLAKSGKWMLEVERYVTVRSQLFRARRETLEGEGAILRALSTAEDTELTDKARLLMRAGTNPERCYEVVEGGFAEAALPDRIADVRPPEERARAEEQEMTRLRDQVISLVAKVECLRMQISGLDDSPRRALPSQTPSAAPASSPRPAAMDTSALAGRDLLAEDEPEAAPAEADGPPPVLELGTASDHREALDTLLLGGATFTEGTEDTAPGLLMIDESYFVSKIVTERAECVGAVLVDAMTLKLLGASIRGLSPDETKAELDAAEPGEMVLAGIKDLASAMVAVIAKSSGNAVVFACDVEKLDPVEVPWLFDVQKRVDLDDSLGGHVLLIAK